jgi:hypothetical protein
MEGQLAKEVPSGDEKPVRIKIKRVADLGILRVMSLRELASRS